MRVGSLVTPSKYWVELSIDSDLYYLAGEFGEGEVGVVLEKGVLPKYGDPVVRVLSPSGVVGWVGEAHLREVEGAELNQINQKI